MRLSPTLVGVLAVLCAIAVGPFLTAPGYSSISNAISELAAQGAPNAWVMRTGFVFYGLGVLIDAVRRWRHGPFAASCFIVFGIAMVLNAVFSHKPIDPAAPYDAAEDELHSLFASVVGAAFTIGTFSVSLAVAPGWRRRACWLAAGAAIALPLGMLEIPQIQGLLQRLMFAVSFAWLVAFLPSGGAFGDWRRR